MMDQSRAAGSASPLPACGERSASGVSCEPGEGAFPNTAPASTPPHPARLAAFDDPTSPRTRGEVSAWRIKLGRALGRAAVLAFCSLLLVVYVAGPVAWLISSSLQREADITAVPPNWLPPHPTLDNFDAIFTAGKREVTYETRYQGDPATGRFLPSGAENLLPSLWNSFTVGAAVAILNLITSITAAYAIAVIHFRGRQTALYSILVTRVIPDIALIVPLFLVIRNLDLINTRAALVITYLAVTLPFTIFILISYFEQIPRDLYRAARADGASHWQALAHVYLPLSLPALVASLMFAFLTSWNEFIFALILTQNIASQTLPIVISGFVMDFTTSFSFINAAGVIAIVPPVVLAIAFERYIVSGLTAGAVKG
jgi:multiple sugar transport system permease protein